MKESTKALAAETGMAHRPLIDGERATDLMAPLVLVAVNPSNPSVQAGIAASS